MSLHMNEKRKDLFFQILWSLFHFFILKVHVQHLYLILSILSGHFLCFDGLQSDIKEFSKDKFLQVFFPLKMSPHLHLLKEIDCVHKSVIFIDLSHSGLVKYRSTLILVNAWS